MKNIIQNLVFASFLALSCLHSLQQDLYAQSSPSLVGATAHQPFRADIKDFDAYNQRDFMPWDYISDQDFTLVATHIRRGPSRPQEVVAVSWIGAFDNTDEYNYEGIFDGNSVVGVVVAKEGDAKCNMNGVGGNDSLCEMARLRTPNPNQNNLQSKFFIHNSGPIKVHSPNVTINGLGNYFKWGPGNSIVHGGWFVHIQVLLPTPIHLPSSAYIMPYVQKTKATKTWMPFSELSRGTSPIDRLIFRSPDVPRVTMLASIWTADELFTKNNKPVPSTAYDRVSPVGIHTRPVKELSPQYNSTTRKVEVSFPESARGLFLQQSSDLKTWTDTFTTRIVPSTANPHLVDPFAPGAPSQLFFRLAEKD